MSTVSYCINSNFGVSAAVSGLNPPNGTIPLPVDPEFPAGVVGGNLRDGDAEFKVANQLYSEFGPAREFSVAYISSLIEFCSSCEAVRDRYLAETGVSVIRWDGGFESGRDLNVRGRELGA